MFHITVLGNWGKSSPLHANDHKQYKQRKTKKVFSQVLIGVLNAAVGSNRKLTLLDSLFSVTQQRMQGCQLQLLQTCTIICTTHNIKLHEDTILWTYQLAC